MCPRELHDARKHSEYTVETPEQAITEIAVSEETSPSIPRKFVYIERAFQVCDL